MWRDDTMLVPAAYWGLFIGTDGGPPWRWICEEAINTNQARQYIRISDGTYYATDRAGMTVSNDDGCTWTADASEISTLQVVSAVSDPTRPRAWALVSNSDDAPHNGLWSSDDAGKSFQYPYPMPNHLPSSVKISPDGQTLVIGSVTNSMPRQAVLHISNDAGMTFKERPLNYQLDGQPLSFFNPTWIDPQDTTHLYIQAETANGTALLFIDGDADPVEAMRTTGNITTMSRNVAGNEIFVGSNQGLYVASAPGGPFTVLSTLGQVQCLSVHDNKFYACAWNYAPDQAAIARLSDDGMSYTKVFQFNDTGTPVDCPASTPVAQICPMIWMNYADQLGVMLNMPGPPSSMMMQTGGCSVARRPSSGNTLALYCSGLLMLLFACRRGVLKKLLLRRQGV